MEAKFKPHVVHETAETGSPRHSTDDLDLTMLPERLDDVMLARVQAIARSPLPALPACDSQHFNQCLRIMQAVLPRRNTDDVGGELFVEAYHYQLGKHPAEAITYLLEKATASCKWFPTIAECLEIIAAWHRWDNHCQRRVDARGIAAEERRNRQDDKLEADRQDARRAWKAKTHDQIAGLDAFYRDLGLKHGWFVQSQDGIYTEVQC